MWASPPERVASTAMSRFAHRAASREGVRAGRLPDAVGLVRPADSGCWADLAAFFEVIADGDWSVRRRPGLTELAGAGWFPEVGGTWLEVRLMSRV